ncbi:MAG: hypothetical protein KF901_33025 [Myxococcales bacterium]|nr:hypothetical protein [Myxococcales bacterium]
MQSEWIILAAIGGFLLLVFILVGVALRPFFKVTSEFETARARHARSGVQVYGHVAGVQRAFGVVYSARSGDPYFVDLDLELPSGRGVRARAMVVAWPHEIAPYQPGARVSALVDPASPEIATITGVELRSA